jgi:UDP-3-O-[3-hydroxymyristoyl] N-acetylglucosamine deacetylase/3-hydroxyacyl-[acyl-carrier-protein] dehydratase
MKYTKRARNKSPRCRMTSSPLAKAQTRLFNSPVPNQQTLNQSVSFSGIGLHSGNKVMMTFLPAPANTGIRFRRVDLDGKPEVEARVENVTDTNRSTTLAKGNVKVHTVEHVLAAFAGGGVDNAIVEIDASEPPIADGSSREYVRMIEEAGIVAQPDARETYAVTAPIELKQGDTVMSLFPHDAFKITCTSADKNGRFTQFFSIEISPEVWKRELSHARTFCFYEEIEYLIKNGLIKGGSLENAVVIRDDAVLTNEPLRYAEEFVRHKILDIIGDLSLVGKPITGHVIAVKPSHGANCELAKAIVAQMRAPLRAMSAFAPPPEEKPAGEKPPIMDVEQIMAMLPHRYPFLLVDKIVTLEENRIVGVKNVTINEPFFQGHFPKHPIMPGVLQLEAIAQVAGILTIKRTETTNALAYFMSAENVKWRKPVLPGDVLVIDVELTKIRGKIAKAKGICRVRDEVVSEADVTFMIQES